MQQVPAVRARSRRSLALLNNAVRWYISMPLCRLALLAGKPLTAPRRLELEAENCWRGFRHTYILGLGMPLLYSSHQLQAPPRGAAPAATTAARRRPPAVFAAMGAVRIRQDASLQHCSPSSRHPPSNLPAIRVQEVATIAADRPALPRSGASAVLVAGSGEVLIIGGYTEDAGNHRESTSEAWVFSPAQGRWQQAAPANADTPWPGVRSKICMPLAEHLASSRSCVGGRFSPCRRDWWPRRWRGATAASGCSAAGTPAAPRSRF
jgi:hypothetical protein